MWLTYVFCLLGTMWGQTGAIPVQTIRGVVVDRETQAPLEGVAVGLSGFTTGAISDASGRFRLDGLTPGRYTLIASMLGYQTRTITGLELSSAKELVLTIELDAIPFFLEEVVVTASSDKTRALNDMAMTSARQFSLQEANRYAAGFGDPSRMALSFAGVTNSGNDDNNEIIIRGNSPKGLLWRLEGIEIPNPNHFSDGQGATSGIISMINSSSLATSDFLTGAFPAEYGNAFSGVFDLRFRRGNDQQYEGAAQMSVLGMEASAEGPLNHSGASYRLNARYSTLDLLFKSGLVNIDPGSFNPAYRDMNYTVAIPTEKAGTFTCWGLAGVSLADDEDNGSRETGKQGLGVWGISHKISTGESGYWYTVFAYSRTSDSYFRDNLVDTLGWINTRNQVYTYGSYRFSSYYNARLNPHLTLRSGAIISSLGYDLLEDRWDNNRRQLVNFLRERDRSGLLQAFSQVKFQTGTRFSATAGVHLTHFLLNGSQQMEPRVGMRYQLTPRSAFSLGIGAHSRIEPIALYLYKRRLKGELFTQPNRNLHALRAVHYVLGYSRTLSPHTRLNIEAYYQNLRDVPVDSSVKSTYSLLNASSGLPSNVLVNAGRGENMGLELTLERSFANGYYFLLTGSLFNSIFLTRDMKWRNTVFNNTFAATVLFGKEFALGRQRQHFLVWNTRWVTRGGNRYTPIDLLASIQQHSTVSLNHLAYEPRLPDYRRIDMGVSYKINRAGATWQLSADIQNLFNRKNPVNQRYDNQTQSLYYNYALPLLPILSFKVDF